MKTPIAFVTGAGSGIGAATALQLAKHCTVYAGGRTLKHLEQTAAQHHHKTILPVCIDVTDVESFRRATVHIPKIDILVVNAGICERTPLNAPGSDATWLRVIDTNLTGAWNTLRALRDKLRPGARVVAVSSGLGKLGRSGYAAYAASKHGLLGIVKCLALELAPQQITVNAVCPGWVDTQMAQTDLSVSATQNGSSITAEFKTAADNIPLGRFVAPEEVANLISWLCSEKAGAVTGQSYNISCGEFGL